MSEENLKLEIGKLKQRIINLEDKYEKLDKDFIDLVNLIRNIKELFSEESINKSFNSLIEESMEKFAKVKLCPLCLRECKIDIHTLNAGAWYCECGFKEEIKSFKSSKKNWKYSGFNPKDVIDSEGEKELPKHENGLNHMHGINSETSDSDSKPAELIGIKPNPEYLNQFIISELPIKDCSNCESVYSPEPSPCATCENYSNWSPSKRLDLPEIDDVLSESKKGAKYIHNIKNWKPSEILGISIDELGKKAVEVRKKCPEFNDYILKFMKAGEKIMSGNEFTEKDGYEIMKEAIELCNPEKNNLTAEEYINKLSNKALKFMNDCFDYILGENNET